MELGALVCTAARPARATRARSRSLCRWRAAGCPAYDGPPRRGQTYAGTDRQCRGRLLEVLRDDPAAGAPQPAGRGVARRRPQRGRCLDGLLDDGLAVQLADDVFALP